VDVLGERGVIVIVGDVSVITGAQTFLAIAFVSATIGAIALTVLDSTTSTHLRAKKRSPESSASVGGGGYSPTQ
jgi:hypothetical protein